MKGDKASAWLAGKLAFEAFRHPASGPTAQTAAVWGDVEGGGGEGEGVGCKSGEQLGA